MFNVPLVPIMPASMFLCLCVMIHSLCVCVSVCVCVCFAQLHTMRYFALPCLVLCCMT